ncbi:type II toxin-antitoxin system RelE/ParE family toxin [Flavobacterium zepuense]|uniref:Type II toxin-antitoxin system RelE/ParE family toxin n=1 Tax=Flavobacterium zepuense TaxID=2593302 RepID=A0A552V836_9FLAO|nr:type II toxin-antitoxin system RelE/ParE family toxin [Flavobacterium zepuense]TRW26628.1 type II toxin-antitoxin system RelE/ParE family toxin [Flavobacterium zepuense]
MPQTLNIVWSARAQADILDIYNTLLEKNSKETARKIRKEIVSAPEGIVFPEQFQYDEYGFMYRRIIVRNYKIFYDADGNKIVIVSVFNTHRHPSLMKG